MKRLVLFLTIISNFTFSSCSSGAKALSLTETYTFPDFGYSINYPENWFVETKDNAITLIAQNEDDIIYYYSPKRTVTGIVILLDHRTLDWLSLYLNLPEDPTINDLFQLNIDEISVMVNPKVEETTIFGEDALKSEFYGNNDQWYYTYAGFTGNEAFYFGYTAPSEESFEEFKPTWDAILETIKEVQE